MREQSEKYINNSFFFFLEIIGCSVTVLAQMVGVQKNKKGFEIKKTRRFWDK